MLEMSNIAIYELWYDYVKSKYGEKATLCHMDTARFIVYIKTEGIYVKRPLPKGKKRKVIGLMKDEFGGKIMREFAAFRAKWYSYLADECDEDKKAKGTKIFVIKKKLKLKNTKTV